MFSLAASALFTPLWPKGQLATCTSRTVWGMDGQPVGKSAGNGSGKCAGMFIGLSIER